MSLQVEDPTTGLSTVAQNKPGQVSATNTSGDAGNQSYGATNTSSEGLKAERCACFLNDVNAMADYAGVVIKTRLTGMHWDLR